MSLSEKELNEIREEADKEYPLAIGSIQENIHTLLREGYTAAAILYRLRSKVLVEALERIRDQKMLPGETDMRFAFNRNWHISVDTLDTYNKSIKP